MRPQTGPATSAFVVRDMGTDSHSQEMKRKDANGCTQDLRPCAPSRPSYLSVFSAFLWAQVSLPCSLCVLLNSLQSVSCPDLS